jgi:hypothetical protein
VSIHLPTLIEKSTFGYLLNIKEKQLEKLAWSFLAKTITIHGHLAKGGGWPLLKVNAKLLKKRSSFEMKLWFISNFQNQLPLIKNHTLMKLGVRIRGSASSTKCYSQFGF